MNNLYNKKIKFYFYNGFNYPELLANNLKELENNLNIEDNYLGNVTNDTIEEIKELLYHYNSIEEMQKYNDNVFNCIWIDPTYNNLKDYNLSVDLNENDYIKEFKGV